MTLRTFTLQFVVPGRAILHAIAQLIVGYAFVRVVAAARPARRTWPVAARERRLVTPVRTVEVLVAKVGGVNAVARRAAELVRGTREVGACGLVRAVVAMTHSVAHAAIRDAAFTRHTLKSARRTSVHAQSLVRLVLTVVHAVAQLSALNAARVVALEEACGADSRRTIEFVGAVATICFAVF